MNKVTCINASFYTYKLISINKVIMPYLVQLLCYVLFFSCKQGYHIWISCYISYVYIYYVSWLIVVSFCPRPFSGHVRMHTSANFPSKILFQGHHEVNCNVSFHLVFSLVFTKHAVWDWNCLLATSHTLTHLIMRDTGHIYIHTTYHTSLLIMKLHNSHTKEHRPYADKIDQHLREIPIGLFLSLVFCIFNLYFSNFRHS